MTTSNAAHPWWTSAVVYQIYPRSFQDSDGDSVGDLNGIRRRLDYLSWLGVDTVWLSPIYPSPMEDFGYDIANYRDVDPLFGTLGDFDALLTEAHARGLRIILDFVPNHTSHRHPWFRASRSSRDNPKRAWYLWHDPAPGGGPPNNWRSVTGGPAWTLDEESGQYYLHSFLPVQPDLNWRHPGVGDAMIGAMRHWLARSVDGLRVDMVDFLLKDAAFRDEPVTDLARGYTFADARHHLNRPETLDLLRTLRRVLDEYPERVFVGEVVRHLPIAKVLPYYGSGDLLHLPFNFALLDTPWAARDVTRVTRDYDAGLALFPHAWPNYTLGNHDQARLASRLGAEQVRLAGLLLLTLRGTPFLYYGDELGLPNVPIPPDRMQDPWERIQPGTGRDPARAPMVWDTTPRAGFSDSEPWLPLPPGIERLSVAAQRADPTSTLQFYRRLLATRRASPALRWGEYQPLTSAPDEVLAYRRSLADEHMLIALNFGGDARTLPLPGHRPWRVRLSTAPNREGGAAGGDAVVLRPHEGLILQVDGGVQ